MNFPRNILAVAFGCATVASQAQAPRLVQLPMRVHPATLTSLPTGALPANEVLHVTVGLPFRDPAGAQAFVDAVSNPKSPIYRHWLTPEEVGQRFGPTVSAFQEVAGYLTGNGLKIHLLSRNRLGIVAEGTVAQVSTAFHVNLETYTSLTPQSQAKGILYAFTAPPSVPAEIAPYIQYVSGLENFTRAKPMGNAITPTQFRTFYNAASLYSSTPGGKGRTVAISNFDGFRVENLPNWYSNSGWSLLPPSQGVGKNVTEEAVDGAYGEQLPIAECQVEGDLDIQSVLAMAPLATVKIYTGLVENSSGTVTGDDELGVLTTEASENVADIVTESYGIPLGDESQFNSYHTQHVAMSAEGITYLNASGDYCAPGIENDPYPDIEPESLVVGGTTTNTDNNGNLTTTTGWGYVATNQFGQTFEEGSGGGWVPGVNVSWNALPAYQKGNGVPTNIPYRLSPDVALNADPNTPYYISLQAGEGGAPSSGIYKGIGGTSAASPTMAGGLAEAEAQIILNGGLPADSHGHQRFGRINDLLYSFNGSSSIFLDITTGTNFALPNGQTSNCTPGWDFVTGWGCINFANFVAAESNLPKVKSVSVSPTTVEGGSSTTVTGTVTLTTAAPPAGSTVTLSSSSSAATVPASVTVASGATTATFTVTTSAVPAATSATLTATTGSTSVTTSLALNAPKVTALSLSPASVVGGNTSTGTVTIDVAAPTGGLSVSLASSNTSVATVPASATVAAGAKTASFTVTTKSVTVSSTSSISASSGGATQSATITATPVSLSTVTLSPTSVYGSQSSTGTITLSGAAPTGGATVALSLSNTTAGSLSASSIVIPAGSTSGTFTISTSPVNGSTAEVVTAKYGTKSVTATMVITAPLFSTFTVSTSSAVGGIVNPTLTATLNYPAGPAGVVITLSATPATAVTLSAGSITIPAGKTTGTVIANTIPVSTNTSVTITAKSPTVTKTVSFVDAAPTLSTFTVSANSLIGGASGTGTVTISGPAPTGAISVTLASSNTSLLTVPASVSVAAGMTSATFTYTTTAVTANKSATITATLHSPITQTITIKP